MRPLGRDEELSALRRRNAELEARLERLEAEQRASIGGDDVERRYRRFVQASTEALFRVDVEPPIPVDLPEREQAELVLSRGIVRECNDAFARHVGLTRAEEVIGRLVEEVWPGPREEKIATLFEDARGGWAPRTSEVDHPSPTGGRTVVMGTVTGFIERGALVYIWGVMRDVSAERRAERALRESLARYEEFVQRSSEPVVRCNCVPPIPLDVEPTRLAELYLDRAVVAECNDAYARRCGFERAVQILGRRLVEVLPEPRESQLAALAPAARARFAAGEYEVEVRMPQGSRRFAARIVGVSANGALTHVWGALRDVTERRQAEDRLREVFDHAAEGICVVGVAPHGELQLESANPACREILRLSLEGVPTEVATVSLPATGVFGTDALRRCLEQGALLDYQATVGPPADRRTFEVQLVPIRDGLRGFRRTVGFARDVTWERRERAARERLEKRLHRALTMEALGRVSSAIAHDFNNILAAILGCAELIERGADRNTVESATAEIVGAAQRGAALTRQLLAFGRQQVLAPVTLDLNETLTKISRLLQRLVGDGVALELDLDPAPTLVAADAGQIEQVIMNLAVNARDAMAGGGTLTISTRNVVEERDGSCVRLTVADTGTGIAAEDLPHVFEPFFTTKEANEGTGLGLATVYGIVTQSHGEVTVESARGLGTTFTVRLPRADDVRTPSRAQAAAHDGGAPQVSGSSSPRAILLVEDNEALRALVRRTLEEHGDIVFAARNGEDALALVDRLGSTPDLLLTGVNMSGMTGPALAERLAARFGHLRVLYMSEHPLLEVDGGDGARERLLAKPFTPQELITKLHALFPEP